LFLWPFIIQAIIHVKNRTYNSIINKTPYEELLKKKPNIDYFRVLGSLTYTLIPKEVRPKGKIIKKSNRGIFIGYESDNNFLVYIPFNQKIISSKNLDIREELNYNNKFLKDISEKNYSSLIEYSNTDFNNNNIIQSRISELEDQEIYPNNQDEPITEENTIIIEVPESYLI
jgi:hypothetical protein